MSLNIGILVVDKELRIVECSESAREVINFGADAIGVHISELAWLSDNMAVLNEIRATVQDHQTRECELTLPDGSPVLLGLNALPSEQQDSLLVLNIIDLKKLKSLEVANAQLNEFVHRVSHDLREPLRMVTSYMGLLADRHRRDLHAEAGEFMDFAIDGAKRMSERMTGLLEYSRVRTQAQPLRAVSLEDVVHGAQFELHKEIEATQTCIELAEDLPQVLADPALLGKLFKHLMSNAIKFHSAEPCVVTIVTQRKAGKLSVQISDNGIGIAPDNHAQTFELFRQLHTRAEYPGVGIGLTLAQQIAWHHGSEIEVDSNLGEGSTFSFLLSLPAGCVCPC